MKKISNYQLFVVTVLFQLGTTVILGFASAAGRDGWLSALICLSLGLIIVFIYLKLFQMMPGKTIVEWYPLQLGKWIGTPIAWVYPILSLYTAGRTLGDLKFLIPATILPKTPSIIFLTLLSLMEAYALLSGIDCICRLGEIFLPILITFSIIEAILILGSNIIHISYITPIAGEGFSKILKTVFPLGIFISYGEVIDLAMLWPLVNDQSKVMKTTLIATLVSGLFITFYDFLAITVLSGTLFSRSYFPLYNLIAQINISDFIENLQSINVLYFLSTSFIKICIKTFAAIRGFQILTYSKNSKLISIFAVIIVNYLGITMAPNLATHFKPVQINEFMISVTLPQMLIFPLILIVVIKLRKFKKYLFSSKGA